VKNDSFKLTLSLVNDLKSIKKCIFNKTGQGDTLAVLSNISQVSTRFEKTIDLIFWNRVILGHIMPFII